MNSFTADLWKVLNIYYLTFVRVLPRLALAVVALVITLFVAHYIRKLIRFKLLKHTDDVLLTGFLAQLTYWVFLLIGLSICLGVVGLEGTVSKILAGAGLSAFILGFALKDIGENFLAGILLAFKRPFKIGDLVDTQGVHGRIIGLNLRETIIKTLDGKDVFVPNALILKTPLFNYSVDNFLRLEFTLNLDREVEHKKAISLIKSTLLEIDGVLNEPLHQPLVHIEDIDATILYIKTSFWIKSKEAEINAPIIKTRVIDQVLSALKQEKFTYQSPKEDSLK
ncbi:mechanosensitive ion channel family protein [Arundinibacter roseus]|uniref:Mechanosensitive ion channel n=1 Tax=Arundinibacter roseus TaxID=2070510 RepID=A0A4R4KEN0_9BACT|nr:mechanosensitive ion channel domain-containing protein [Arundinibacter roseus]TDB65246.1 mechanosensitive ion channel [Arundinibacter roseus]